SWRSRLILGVACGIGEDTAGCRHDGTDTGVAATREGGQPIRDGGRGPTVDRTWAAGRAGRRPVAGPAGAAGAGAVLTGPAYAPDLASGGRTTARPGGAPGALRAHHLPGWCHGGAHTA